MPVNFIVHQLVQQHKDFEISAVIGLKRKKKKKNVTHRRHTSKTEITGMFTVERHSTIRGHFNVEEEFHGY